MSEPIDLAALKEDVKTAWDELGEVCAQGPRNRFRMSVPANERRDTDLIIGRALNGLDALIARVVNAERELAECRATGVFVDRQYMRAHEKHRADLAAHDAVIEKVRGLVAEANEVQRIHDAIHVKTNHRPCETFARTRFATRILALLDAGDTRPDETGALIPGARCSMCGESATTAVAWPEVNGPVLVALCDGHFAATRTARAATDEARP